MQGSGCSKVSKYWEGVPIDEEKRQAPTRESGFPCRAGPSCREKKTAG